MLSYELQKLRTLIWNERVCLFSNLSGEVNPISRPLYTADIDEEGRLYFFINDDSGDWDTVQWNKPVYLFYNNSSKRIHLQIAGRCSMIINEQRIRDCWSPLLNSYFPKGLRSTRLIMVEPTSATYWSDCYQPKTILLNNIPSKQAIMLPKPALKKAI